MTFRFILAFLFLRALIAAQSSTFDATNENWRASGDPTNTNAFWEPSGGNPGGYIRVVDDAVGGLWYFDAPTRYTGNKCDAYGKYLRWDQFTSDTLNQFNPIGTRDVVLESGTLTLVYDNPQNPGLAWTHFDVLLREDAGWRIGNANGPAPTQAQFQAVLANLSGLRIQGEYRSQADFGGLDNVVLESVFQFDLDADDSSGAPNGDFRADTSCAPLAPIADADALLFSEKRVDSIVLRLPFSQNPAFEIFLTGALPPGIAALSTGPGALTLINTGAAIPADFLAALKAVQYADNSPTPLRAVRIVSVLVFTECGNMGQRYAYLPIFPPGYAGENADTVLCAGGPPLDLFSALGGNPQTGGFWQPALSQGNLLFQPGIDAPGRYRYIIPDAGPCPGDTAAVAIEVEQAFSLRSDTTICYNDTLLLPIPLQLINWTWSDGSRQSILEVTEPGLYWLEGNTGNCAFSDSVQVDFFTCAECPVYVPNVFSPNDDGRNDTWQVFMDCAWLRFRLEVFDRWGNLVFAADSPDQAWNGAWRGQKAPPGVYGWRLEWEGELRGAGEVYRMNGEVGVVR